MGPYGAVRGRTPTVRPGRLIVDMFGVYSINRRPVGLQLAAENKQPDDGSCRTHASRLNIPFTKNITCMSGKQENPLCCGTSHTFFSSFFPWKYQVTFLRDDFQEKTMEISRGKCVAAAGDENFPGFIMETLFPENFTGNFKNCEFPPKK